MDVNSGRLVADINQVPVDVRHHFTPVPKHLQGEALHRLGGRSEVIVSPEEQSRLAAWAAKRKVKNRRKSKLAKRARKAARR